MHGYEPAYGYTYSNDYYVYSQPRVVYYYDDHYDPYGDNCGIRGRHSHDYVPPTHAASAYSWDRTRNSYVYRPSPGSSVTPPRGQGANRPPPRSWEVPSNQAPRPGSPPRGNGGGWDNPRPGNDNPGRPRPRPATVEAGAIPPWERQSGPSDPASRSGRRLGEPG